MNFEPHFTLFKSHYKFLLNITAVSSIDTSGTSLLKDLNVAMEKKNVEASENSFQTN